MPTIGVLVIACLVGLAFGGEALYRHIAARRFSRDVGTRRGTARAYTLAALEATWWARDVSVFDWDDDNRVDVIVNWMPARAVERVRKSLDVVCPVGVVVRLEVEPLWRFS